MTTNAVVKKVKKEELIYNSNDLIQNLRHSLTLQEQRIFCLLLSRIQRYDRDFYWQEFGIEELARAIGVSKGGNTRKSIEAAVMSMSSKKFWHKLGDKRRTKMVVGFLQDGSAVNDEGVSLLLSPSLKPFLLEMYDIHGKVVKPYTVYALQLVSQFRSRYSLPLYEYLRSTQFKRRQWSTVLTAEDCKDILGVNQDKPWCNFNKNALSVAIADINRVSDITIELELIKTGRQITSLKFICCKKKGYEDAIEDKVSASSTETEVVELDTLLAYDDEDDGEHIIDPEALCDYQPPDVEDEAFFAACLVDVDVD